MPNDDVQKTSGKMVAAVFNMLGGIGGVLALGIVIWKGGALERQIEVNSGRISIIENLGSPTARTHEIVDEERVKELKRRISETDSRVTSLEVNLQQYGELKVEIRVLGTKLDGIASRLKGIEDAAMQQLNSALRIGQPK